VLALVRHSGLGDAPPWTSSPVAAQLATSPLVTASLPPAPLALWLGVPDVANDGNLRELLDAIGKVGVGVAASFGAFLLGSMSDDLAAVVFRTRGALPLTAGQADPAVALDRMGEGVRTELDRLEGEIDRLNSEVILRGSLIPPLIVAGVAGGVQAWYWIAAGIVASLVLAAQMVPRTIQFRRSRETSIELRRAVARSLGASDLAEASESSW